MTPPARPYRAGGVHFSGRALICRHVPPAANSPFFLRLSAPKLMSVASLAPQLPAGSSIDFAALPYCSTSLFLRQNAQNQQTPFRFRCTRRHALATPGDSASKTDILLGFLCLLSTNGYECDRRGRFSAATESTRELGHPFPQL
jgi:hypothetical protein